MTNVYCRLARKTDPISALICIEFQSSICLIYSASERWPDHLDGLKLDASGGSVLDANGGSVLDAN